MVALGFSLFAFLLGLLVGVAGMWRYQRRAIMVPSVPRETATLPPASPEEERAVARRLAERYGARFNQLPEPDRLAMVRRTIGSARRALGAR
jgi:hypothetical protein